MRFSIPVSLLIFTLAFSATAQNFQPFKNKYKYQYTYTGYIMNQINTELIHGIEVDSAVLIGSDSIFYFNQLQVEYAPRSNFFGDSLIKKINGEYLFLGSNYTQTDTVILKTQEILGALWTFKLNNILYTVHYNSYEEELVLTNQMDYVKTFLVENTSGFKDSIKISEKFGLVYSFPFFDNLFFGSSHFNLTYILNTKTGINKLNFFDYFNYDIGDILIYQPNLTYPNRPPVGNDIFKVLTKIISLNGDTVTYLFSLCHIDAFDGSIYSTNQTHCKLIVTECSVNGDFPYTYPLTFPPNKYGEYLTFAPNMNNNRSLLIAPPMVFEAPVSSYSFQIGSGLSSYSFSGNSGFNDGMPLPSKGYANIRYIKQSILDDDCNGLELILDTKNLQTSSGKLLVSPNPFENSILLNASNLTVGNWNLRIVSTLGVEVHTSSIVISSSNQEIDLSNLPALTAGIYFLTLENEGQVYIQKIVKNNY